MIYRNTSRKSPWKQKAEILTEFSHTLKLSGYKEDFRLQTIQAAVSSYQRQCARADAGQRPLHRLGSYNKEERRRRKLMTKTSWYRPSETVGFYPATPKQTLAKEIQRIVSEEGARIGIDIKIVETGGTSLRSQLVRTNLSGCVAPQCYICESGRRGASHTRRGANYEVTCKECRDQNIVATYYGETGDGAFKRANEHRIAVKKGTVMNALAKHLEIHHPERKFNPSIFEFIVHSTTPKALERQTLEGVQISKSEADIILNSKSQFRQPAIHRVVTTREVDTNRRRGEN